MVLQQETRATTVARLRAAGYGQEAAERHAAAWFPDPDAPPRPAFQFAHETDLTGTEGTREEAATAPVDDKTPKADNTSEDTAEGQAETNGQVPEASQAAIRAWAKSKGIEVNPRGTVWKSVQDKYYAAERRKAKARARAATH